MGRVMKLIWNAWYGDDDIEIWAPPGWDVRRADMAGAAPADAGAVDRALANPIGTAPLRELAGRAADAVIVVEDITRPGPTAQIVPRVIAHLEQGGMVRDRMRIIMGTGGHMLMNRHDLLLKLGREALETVEVTQHNCFENLDDLGVSTRGTPIRIGRLYLEKELRIGVGSVTPHSLMGFGGGAKIGAVGVGGLDTIYANHTRGLAAGHGGVGRVDGNPSRDDLEEIAERAGLAFIVDVVLTARREIAAAFAGHPVAAHRAGSELARRVYSAPLPPPADVAVINAYPKDSELILYNNALCCVGHDLRRAIRPGGSVVVMMACAHGVGFHYWNGRNGREYRPPQEGPGGGPPLILFTQNLSHREACQRLPASTLVLDHWADVVVELARRHGERATMNVYPCGALQIPLADPASS